MKEKVEPKWHGHTKQLGSTEIVFMGEQYEGHPILDTRVSIMGRTICWITWAEKESFYNELKATFDKYSI